MSGWAVFNGIILFLGLFATIIEAMGTDFRSHRDVIRHFAVGMGIIFALMAFIKIVTTLFIFSYL